MFGNKGLPMSEALFVSLLGIVVVMVALAALAVCIVLISKGVLGLTKAGSGAVPASAVLATAPVSVATPKVTLPPVDAVNLHNVDDETAALIMAIVADKLQKPVEQLYFNSIREV